MTVKRLVHKIKELEDENMLLNKNLKRLDEFDASIKMQAIKSDANAEFLHIVLINQMELSRSTINKQLFDNMVVLNDKRAQLIDTEKALENQRETFYAVPTTQSKSTVAPNRILIALGGVLSGLVIGILSALLVDFFTKLRRKEM